MSQLPDKIWVHKDTKYSTADTVCGYQYKFLAENEGIDNFAEYIHSEVFIDRGSKWLEETLKNTDFYEDDIELMINEFKKSMKEK